MANKFSIYARKNSEGKAYHGRRANWIKALAQTIIQLVLIIHTEQTGGDYNGTPKSTSIQLGYSSIFGRSTHLNDEFINIKLALTLKFAQHTHTHAADVRGVN